MKKTEIQETLADAAGVTKKQVSIMMKELVDILINNAKDRFKFPDLGIFYIKVKPAREKRKGMNPFTKKEQWFKAKPESKQLKFRPTKATKDAVAALKIKSKEKKKKKDKKKKKK